jgi:hypothetical protein
VWLARRDEHERPTPDCLPLYADDHLAAARDADIRLLGGSMRVQILLTAGRALHPRHRQVSSAEASSAEQQIRYLPAAALVSWAVVNSPRNTILLFARDHVFVQLAKRG